MNLEEDFVIVNKEDVIDETNAREPEEQIIGGQHLNNEFISNDEAIARELQLQINKEYNEDLKRLERIQNGTSKLNISYEKYRNYENYDRCHEEECDDYDPPDYIDWDNVNLNTRKKKKSLMTLHPNVQTGDGVISHVEISNSVLNGLKRHSHNEMLRENMHHKEKDDTKYRKLDKVSKNCLISVDQSTNKTIHSLIMGMNPCLLRINGRVREGKESLIYYGEKIHDKAYYYFNEHRNFDCILKLYKLNMYNFGQENYLEGDYRYKDRYSSKMNKFNKVCLWAEKERDNLERLKKYILCPEPIMLKNNVLVMSFIGSKGRPARRLRYANLKKREYRMAYEQIVENMRIMYKKARLVHADLSEFNILWHNKKCYFIDVSQAVDISHVDALEFLKRDCKTIIDFFDRKQIPYTMTKEELFKHITNQDYNKSLSSATRYIGFSYGYFGLEL